MKGSGSIAGLLPVICLMVGLAGYPVQLRAVTLDQIIDLITEAHGPVNHERRVKLFSDALTSLQVWEKTHRGRGHQRARCAVYGMLAFTEDPALESVAYTIYSMLREEPVCGDVLWNERRMLDVLEERLSGNAGVVETGGRFEERGIRTVSYEHTKGGIQPRTDVALSQATYGPLSSNERLAFLARQVPVGYQDVIASLGARLLSDAGLNHEIAAFDDMVVFGAKAEGRTQDFAGRLRRQYLALRDAYFGARPPDRILTVYANLSPESRWGAALSEAVHFRPRPDLESYYRPEDHSIVLLRGIWNQGWYMGSPNHELVHALMAVDFPRAPRWLDEGLAAMHEATSGELAPVDNYRLYYLKAALERGVLPSLSALLNFEPAEPADRWVRLMDALARYFCIYLWERGPGGELLKSAYAALRSGSGDSAQVLQRLTGQSLRALDREFRSWVAGRSTRTADRHWSPLRYDIEGYVRSLPQARPGSQTPAAPSPSLASVVRPRAAMSPLGGNRYLFSFWLEVPVDRQSDIRAVSYFLDHPSFPEKWFRGGSAAQRYAASYRGWGCLRNVEVHIALTDGSKQMMSFDMCEAIGER